MLSPLPLPGRYAESCRSLRCIPVRITSGIKAVSEPTKAVLPPLRWASAIQP